MKGSAHTVPRMPGIVCLAALTAIGGCGDSAPGDEVVARAAGYELSVDQTADLLARQTQLPDQADVVEAIAGLWIDYTLFAVAVLEDSTFQHIDLLPLVRQEIEQELVARLRERVIQVDTAFTEEQLRQIYEEQAAGVELRARHILLALDPGADAPTADSVMEFAGGLRERILAGEDFAALAGEFSQDPGTATQGGDLGSFRRGQMVPAFDSAAFALAPGEAERPRAHGFRSPHPAGRRTDPAPVRRGALPVRAAAQARPRQPGRGSLPGARDEPRRNGARRRGRRDRPSTGRASQPAPEQPGRGPRALPLRGGRIHRGRLPPLPERAGTSLPRAGAQRHR